MQIFILGMHRSGTSLVARLVNMMGAYFGGEGVGLPTNDENPKGFWERRDVVALNERLFAEQNSTWFDVLPIVERAVELPGSSATPTSTDAAIGALVGELDAHRPWFVKDPRLCLTFRHWRAHCEVPIAIVCLRNIGAVADSMSKRSGTIGLSYHEAIALSKAHLAIMAQHVIGVPCVVVHYERLLTEPVGETRRLYAALSDMGAGSALRMPEDVEIERFVEPTLRRSRGDDAYGPMGDELAGALASGQRIDSWLGGETLELLRDVRRRRDDEDRRRSQRYAESFALSARLMNVALLEMFAADEHANGSAPWTLERLRRLIP